MQVRVSEYESSYLRKEIYVLRICVRFFVLLLIGPECRFCFIGVLQFTGAFCVLFIFCRVVKVERPNRVGIVGYQK